MNRLFIAILISCSSVSFAQAQHDVTLSDWMPLTLEPDTTIVYLEDLFVSAGQVEQVQGPAWLQTKLNKSEKTFLIITTGRNIPPISIIDIKAAGTVYNLVVYKSKKEQVAITFNPQGKSYQSVAIAGDMNGWNPALTPLTLKNGIWETTMLMNPGRYQYLIATDSTWMPDPNNPLSVASNMGGTNSLMVIGEKDRSQLPFFYLKETVDHKIAIGSDQRSNNDPVFVIWNNRLIPHDDGETIRTVLPAEAEAVPYSFLRVFGYNTAGGGNDLLIPLEFGKVVTNPAAIDRHDFHTSIMYFLLVDRFHNGDKNNDRPVNDARLDPRANYQGGDLAGIMEKLEDGYFTNLGFNTLWLSPVMQNPWQAYQEYPEPHRWFAGYHGYWPISLSQVDQRFGNNELFKALVDSLHQKDMNIVFDYIANHVHAEHPLWEQHPEWFTNLELPDGRKNLRLWDEQRLSTWFEPYMPSLDHSQPVVANASADSALYWIKEFGIDGFRHDATKHIETEFWRLLTRKIRMEVSNKTGNPIYQIGETFGSRELIGSYLGSGLLDAQFDFNMYFDARNMLASDAGSFIDLSASLHNTFDYYGYHHLMGNITGNHDLARFISYAGNGLRFDENDKEAGWQREIKVEDATGYKKLELLHVFNMTIPGIPIVYYGDEMGMPGAGDPDNRRMMQFSNLSPEEQHVKVTVRQLAQMRAQNMALLYGDFKELMVTETVWVYSRIYMNNKVVVCMNKGNTPAIIDIELPPALAGIQSGGQGQQQGSQNQQGQGNQGGSSTQSGAARLSLTIPAYGYEILVAQ